MATSNNVRSARIIFCAAIATIAMFASADALQAQQQVNIPSLEQLVSLAIQANPSVQAARERWVSATHQIEQNYVPADPIFTYMNIDSRGFPLYQTSQHTVQIQQPLQFPGKGLLQGDQATRVSHIAKLGYEAAVRDVRAQVEVAYYQHALDVQLGGINGEQVTLLRQVEQVATIGYEANQVTQADFIAAHLALIAIEQQVLTYRLNVENDLTQLNMLTYRRPDEPLVTEENLGELRPLKLSLDELIDQATDTRQEILQAALSERNAGTASTLARMEYLPDYTITYFFDDYLLPSGAPAPSRTEDHSL
jgi:outer membrane protein TolC